MLLNYPVIGWYLKNRYLIKMFLFCWLVCKNNTLYQLQIVSQSNYKNIYKRNLIRWLYNNNCWLKIYAKTSNLK